MLRKAMLFLLPIVLPVATSLPAVAQSDEVFYVYDIDNDVGLDLGSGFDILTATPRNQCVQIQETVDHPELGPSNVLFRSYKIENSQQLDKVLGFSASASIKFGIGGGSVSSSYLENLSVSSYSLNYVVEASVFRKGKSVKVQDLQDRYRKLLSSGNPEAYQRFRTICGDGYIAEMPSGGAFKALIQIATNSRAEAQAISASIGGAYGALSGSASFTSAIKSVAKTNEVRIWSLRRGGDGPVPITADDIANSAANLPNSVKQAPTSLQIVVLSYLGILDDPMLPMSTFLERSGQIQRLAALSQKARDQLSDAQYILSHPDQFQGQPSDAIALGNEINALRDFREFVNVRADQCVRRDGVCLIDDLVVPSPLARPARR